MMMIKTSYLWILIIQTNVILIFTYVVNINILNKLYLKLNFYKPSDEDAYEKLLAKESFQ